MYPLFTNPFNTLISWLDYLSHLDHYQISHPAKIWLFNCIVKHRSTLLSFSDKTFEEGRESPGKGKRAEENRARQCAE